MPSPNEENGPPAVRPRGTAATTPKTTSTTTTKPGYPQFSRVGRQCRCNTPVRWRYADDWRAVFRRGALDALRRAAREVDDPAVWVVLDRLADEYGLAQ
jgi:hypothetical protein